MWFPTTVSARREVIPAPESAKLFVEIPIHIVFESGVNRMELIDEKGRLFGRVNIIDALVVLVVVAVVVAGVALVATAGEEEQEETDVPQKYGTLSLDDQSSWVVSRVATGDTWHIGNANVTVTDVYATPGRTGVEWELQGDDTYRVQGESDRSRLVVRVRYPATDGSPIGQRRHGDRITVGTEAFRSKAHVLQTNGSSDRLQTSETPVHLTSRVNAATAASIDVGDEYRLGNRTAATVESVQVVPVIDDSRKLARLGIELETIRLGGERRFAGYPVQIGREIAFQTSAYGFHGEITDRGSLEPPGEPVPVSIDVAWDDVHPDTAEQIAEGMSEQHRGATATVTDVTVDAASTQSPTDSRPDNRDVTVTVNATARRVGNELRFHGRQLQSGSSIRLDFGTVTVRGTVTDVTEK